jgi:hypothetical protein
MAIVRQDVQIALQGPAVGPSLLGLPKTLKGQMKSLRAKLQPALLLGLMGWASRFHQFAVADQLRGRPAEIGWKLESQSFYRDNRETQPTTIEKQHGKICSPALGPLEFGEAKINLMILGFRQGWELQVLSLKAPVH